ncbi:hypothetical protein [Olivibacter sitiensis]|uniref:hypothetical protein n=1 Tax=Olivibacter sitiensis TaxID=376470 RepID=UPI00040F1DF7|nr:hypothetical protein [Olivibacter sitiensis]
MEEYRQHLVDSALNFIRFMAELQTNIAHLLIDRSFAEKDELFEGKEATCFLLADFENVDDKNIQELIKLHDSASEAYDLFSSINDISAFDTMEAFHEGVFDERLGVVERWEVVGERIFAMETVVPSGFPCPEFQDGLFASPYRHYLVKAIITLRWYTQVLYGNMAHLVLFGGFSEASERLRGDQDLEGDMNDFEGVDDQNIQELMKMYNVVKEHHDSSCKTNKIRKEEIQFFIFEED